MLEAQKHEAQRSFLESKQTTEQHMSDLEQQVIELRNELAKERTTILTLKDDSHRSLKHLQTENSQLRDNLSKVLNSTALICKAANCQECCRNVLHQL